MSDVSVTAEQMASVQGVLVALGVGLAVTAVYFLLFYFKKGKAPATGSIGYLVFETVAIFGILHVLWRMAHLEYVGKLNSEEHLYIGLGAIVGLSILGKRVFGVFREASSSTNNSEDPRTEDDGG